MILFNVYECFAYVCTTFMKCLAQSEVGIRSPELEPWMIVSFLVHAEN